MRTQRLSLHIMGLVFILALVLAVNGRELHAGGSISLLPLGTYETGTIDESAAEIPAYDPLTQQIFVVNAADDAVDVLDASDPTNPSYVSSIDLSSFGSPNSVDVKDGLLAIAVQANVVQDPGAVFLYDTTPTFVMSYTAGALPDMVKFSPDGNYALSANEGEPNDDYTVDPEGSITVVDIVGNSATNADFSAFNPGNIDSDIRIFGPGATVPQDLEPEYIAISADSSAAYVTLQENNALAIVDIATATVTDLVALGFKDYTLPANTFDASNEDGGVNMANWPVFGMYLPDAIDAYEVGGQTYLVTANEGDSRDYDGFSEEERVADLTLDPAVFPDAATLQLEENLGRLNVTSALGNTDGDADYEEIYAYGARSFTIWDSAGNLVYDSGNEIETRTADLIPEIFNSQGTSDSFDSRSDDKGPEPEAVAIGMVDGSYYAFIGMERVGGIMVFNIDDPVNPFYITYRNNAIYDGDVDAGTAGDIGPEGLEFVSPADSPNGQPLLIVANEVSGTTTIFQILTAPTDVSVSTFGDAGESALGFWIVLLVFLVSATAIIVIRRRDLTR